ncbi:MAG: sulfurtransferase TusA family protein [Deltaproteobacteria bacterium]
MNPEIDITKDVCPMTFVKVKIAMTKIAPSGKLTVLLGGEALKNVISSVKTEGHRVTGVTRRESAYLLEIEKKGEGPG